MNNMSNRYEHEIPEGYEARIEGNKVVIEKVNERIRKEIQDYFNKKKDYRSRWFNWVSRATTYKPAEWSKEDERMLLSIINAFRNGTVSTIGQEQWLKSLPERFNLQPKQEWSEEDEKIITRLIDYFESFRIDGVATKWEGLGVQEVITLLKSLRPSWKPREEQMKALLNAEKYLNAGLQYGSERRIAELYEQLKKL